MSFTTTAYSHVTVARTNDADIANGLPASATDVAAELDNLVTKVNTVGTAVDTLSDTVLADLTTIDKGLGTNDHTDQADQNVTLNATTDVGKTHVIRHNTTAPATVTVPAISGMTEGWAYRLFCLNEIGCIVRIPNADNGLATLQASDFNDGVVTYDYVPLNHGDSMEIFTGLGTAGTAKYLYQVFRCDRFIFCRQEITHAETANFLNKANIRVVLIDMNGSSGNAAVTLPDLTASASQVYHGETFIISNSGHATNTVVMTCSGAGVITGKGNQYDADYAIAAATVVSMIADCVNDKWYMI